jgi:hypothetical protein
MAETQFNVYVLGDVVRVEAGAHVEDDPESNADLYLQCDADTAERVGRELIDSASLARRADEDGPRPANGYGIAVE